MAFAGTGAPVGKLRFILISILLTEGNNAFGVSSPAYPALTVLDPRSITRAFTSSARAQEHSEIFQCPEQFLEKP
jgi:hypothetical protein